MEVTMAETLNTEIDFSAALGEAPRRGRGRPKKVTQVEPKRGRGRPKGSGKPQKPYIDNNILLNNKTLLDREESLEDFNIDDDINKSEEVRSATSIKNQLTLKELKFIELYMLGNYTQVNALKLAGYAGYNEKYLELLARKIIGKFESQADDHRKLFRALGAGETFIVKGLLSLAKNAKSEMVRLRAYESLSKCMGLTKEQIEGAGGVTIIFEAADRPAGAPRVPPPLPGSAPVPATGLPGTGKPMMITK
jgi:hypothetical protein